MEFKKEINQDKYYYIFDDINIRDYTLLNDIKEKSNELEKPIILKKIPTEIGYDIELHKIGKSCHGMKKRYGIIQNGGIFSSKEPRNKIKDLKKLKDKSQYLQGAEIIKETKEQWEHDQSKSKGEWHSKNKTFRIRVNYFINPGDKESKQSSFYLYLDNEQSLNEVYLIISNMQLSLTNKESIIQNLDNFNSMLLKNQKFYTILKILSVKNKIKERKGIFNKVQNYIKNGIKISANLDPNFLEPKKEEPIPSLVGEVSGEINVDNEKIDIDVNSGIKIPDEKKSEEKPLKAQIKKI